MGNSKEIFKAVIDGEEIEIIPGKTRVALIMMKFDSVQVEGLVSELYFQEESMLPYVQVNWDDDDTYSGEYYELYEEVVLITAK